MPEPLSTLVDNIRPYVHGCPNFVILPEVRKAYISFCQKTRILTRDIQRGFGAEDVYGDNDEVSVNVAGVIPGHSPMTVHWLTVDGSPRKILHREAPVAWPGEGEAPTGAAKYYYFSHSGTVKIYPFSNATSGFSLALAVEFAPSKDVAEMDDGVFAEWHEAIEAGAMERIYKLPRREWSDRGEAERCRIDFYRAVSSARIQHSVRASGGDLTVRMRPLI